MRPERSCTKPAGASPATVSTPGAPCSRLRASGEIRPSKRSVESRKRGVRLVEGEQSCGPNTSEPLQPREIGTERQGGRADHFAAKATRGRTVTGDPQDALGVGEGARSEGLVWNRRDPPRWPTSGEGGGYKPKAKCHRTGRESEGLVVPRKVVTRTPPEGRGPALVVLAERGKGEGMPYGLTTPLTKPENLGVSCPYRRVRGFD